MQQSARTVLLRNVALMLIGGTLWVGSFFALRGIGDAEFNLAFFGLGAIWLGLLLVYRYEGLRHALFFQFSALGVTAVFLIIWAASGHPLASKNESPLVVILSLGWFLGTLFSFPIAVVTAVQERARRCRTEQHANGGSA